MPPRPYCTVPQLRVGSKSHNFFLTRGKFIIVCISLYFCIFSLLVSVDRPILLFGGLTLSLSIRFAPPQTVIMVEGSLLPYLGILLLHWS